MGAAVAVALALPTLNASAAAADAAGPSLVAKSYVGGRVSPVPAIIGRDWTWRDGAWSVEIRSVSLPSGTTRIASTWRSPIVVTRPKVPFFAVKIEQAHQGTSSASSGYVDAARVCIPHRGCDKWWNSESADASPQEFTAAFPYRVSLGHGMRFASLKAGRVYVQWRFVQTQAELDEQTTDLTVAVGKGAAVVWPDN